MKSKLIHEENGLRTYVLFLQPGEEIVRTFLDFAAEHDLTASKFSGNGSIEDLTLGFRDESSFGFKKISIAEPVEMLCFSGNIAFDEEGQTQFRIHTILGSATGKTFGGYLLEAYACSEVELILVEIPKYMQYGNSYGSLSINERQEERR